MKSLLFTALWHVCPQLLHGRSFDHHATSIPAPRAGDRRTDSRARPRTATLRIGRAGSRDVLWPDRRRSIAEARSLVVPVIHPTPAPRFLGWRSSPGSCGTMLPGSDRARRANPVLAKLLEDEHRHGERHHEEPHLAPDRGGSEHRVAERGVVDREDQSRPRAARPRGSAGCRAAPWTRATDRGCDTGTRSRSASR